MLVEVAQTPVNPGERRLKADRPTDDSAGRKCSGRTRATYLILLDFQLKSQIPKVEFLIHA